MMTTTSQQTAASERKTAELLTAYPEAADALTNWISGFLAGAASIRSQEENQCAET